MSQTTTYAQQVVLDALATSDASGNASFVFTPVQVTFIFTGTLNCQNAPPSAQFQATVGTQGGEGTPWGTWGGPSTFGPIQANSGLTLTVTATQLKPNTQYALSWRGRSEPAALAQILYPGVDNSALLSLTVGNNVDFLGTVTSGSSLSVFTETFKANRVYQAIAVVSNFAAGAQPLCAVSNDRSVVSGSPVVSPTFVSSFPPPPAVSVTGDLPLALLGSVNQAGDTISVTVYYSSATTPTIWVYGITSILPFTMRSDGRAYPIGTLFANVQTAAGGSATVIAAPTTPLRILLRHISVGSTGGAFQLAGTISGGGVAIAQSLGAISLFAVDLPPGGLLLDTATAVTLNAVVGSTQGAQISYDLVI